MIKVIDNIFVLNTNKTTYAFKILETKHLEHLFYGPKVDINKNNILAFSHKENNINGCVCSYDINHPNFTLDDYPLEISSIGKGDLRTPSILIEYSDKTTTSDFLFEKYEIIDKYETKDMPFAKNSKETLKITLKEKYHNVFMFIYYSVYENENVIVRGTEILNKDKDLIIKSIMSNHLDFEDHDYNFISFQGDWANEMNKAIYPLIQGKYFIESINGSSSNRANPFVMIERKDTSEKHGEIYAFNLIYSGNHIESIEVDSHGKTRFLSGINPLNFDYQLKRNELFTAPQSMMTYTNEGYSGLRINTHDFVNNHIISKSFSNVLRPILVNSWEAYYMNINESKIYELALKAKKLGIELIVIDDGWFSNRNNDKSSLGDWYLNKKKFPSGFKNLSNKINELGLKLGLWVEPEMVNVDSDLYRNHQDYVLEIKGQDHSEGRNQRILDLTNPKVREYIIDSLRKILNSGNIEYIKWDMNRNYSDYYSPYLKQSNSLNYLYIKGLYEIMDTITKEYPNVLFEGCASGGNRFDLGILSYFHQNWASDNTDAITRLNMQENYAYGYPQSAYTAHVSSSINHQTLRQIPISSRYAISSFANFGYELNLNEINKKEETIIKEQIKLYKKYQDTIQYGDFKVLINDDEISSWEIVSKDKEHAIVMIIKKKFNPSHQFDLIKTIDLDNNSMYHFYSIPYLQDIKKFGELINYISPIHIKKDGIIHNLVDKFYKLNSEIDDYILSGNELNNIGIKLNSSFVGTGMNEGTRILAEYDSRIYYIDKIKEA